MDETEKMTFDVSIIIINYNTKKLLIDCIRSVYRFVKNISFEIIVVDNSSSDGSVPAVKQEFPNLVIVENSENVGFAPANNQAINIAAGKNILLLNSDTILLNNAVKKMTDYLNSNPEAGIVGPKVLNKDRTIQSSYSRFPNLKYEVLRAFRMEAWYVRHRIQSDKRIEQGIPFQVDWVTGCCFLIRTSVVDQIGLLDESYFLFNEEVDWSLRATKAGWKIYYIPEALIIHLGGQSTSKNPYFYLIHRYKTRLYFYKKHKSPLVLFLFRLIVSFGLIFRLLLIPFSSFHGPTKKQRKKAYWDSLLFHIGCITGENK
ncbi:glycosyltransferase family 2 protein [candidate division KSB1 bacterium]|nr:glycosyltransferase family 2 protein [candidate division KSB1 bacterium]